MSQIMSFGPHDHLMQTSLGAIAAQFASGELTSVSLTQMYLDRIVALDTAGPTLGAVLETNPDAITIAAARDAESVRGPLHGIPVLVKDNLDTADAMHTSAGSMALMDSRPDRDATVVKQLRDAGAVILGKTNLSEWANMRGKPNVSGWSSRGQTKNPHCLVRNPSGSSSGSAAAVAAGFAPVSIGTETDGSIICPASACGVVGLKPTVGLTSRAGVIPISSSQDSVGIFATNVRDIAVTLGCITGVDDRDAATRASAHMTGVGYDIWLNPEYLRGKRLGVPTNFGFQGYNQHTDAIFRAALDVLTDLGAVIVPDTNIPSADELSRRPGEMDRLLYEFRRAINAYLVERHDPYVHTLADLVAHNRTRADVALQYFGQEVFLRSEATKNADPVEMAVLNDRLGRLSRDEGIDATLAAHRLDALIAPSMSPAALTDLLNGENHGGSASCLSAIAGYPIISVPMGRVYGMPVGISFMGTAWSEPILLGMAYAWEQATQMYRKPAFVPGDIVQTGVYPRLEFPTIQT